MFQIVKFFLSKSTVVPTAWSILLISKVNVKLTHTKYDIDLSVLRSKRAIWRSPEDQPARITLIAFKGTTPGPK